MSSINKDIITPRVTARGVAYGFFLLLLICSLFFIPEIVRLQEYFTGGTTSSSHEAVKSQPQQLATNDVDLDELLPPEEKPMEQSSLDKLLQMIQGKDQEIGEESEAIAVKTRGSAKSLQELQDKLFYEKTITQESVTWQKLGSNQALKAFQTAHDGASKLLKNIPSRQSSVRFALLNYINGLNWISRGEKKTMSADNALAYIEQLDVNVTQAMLSSEIDAADFNSWKKISLGPISVHSRALNFKTTKSISFNPRLQLATVSISKTPEYTYSRNGDAKANKVTSKIQFGGFVLGKDVKKVTVFKNGKLLGEARPSKAGTDGMRTFTYATADAYGLFTLRAISDEGQVYQKSYVFLPRVVGKFAQDANNSYILPFGTPDFKDISVQNIDTRLDRYFRVKVKTDKDSSGFDTF